jgi:cob(I)alamin adenosyltransferase
MMKNLRPYYRNLAPLKKRFMERATYLTIYTMKIYTKTGDDGTTGLLGGVRVSKADAQIEAYGTVDELNSYLGLTKRYVPEIPSHTDSIDNDSKSIICYRFSFSNGRKRHQHERYPNLKNNAIESIRGIGWMKWIIN